MTDSVPDLMADPVGSFITLSWSPEAGIWTLDLGDVTHWEASGVLKAALDELSARNPDIKVRFNGEAWDDDDADDD